MFDGQVSSRVPLMATTAGVKFYAASGGLTAGDRWALVDRQRPSPGLPDILAAVTNQAGAALDEVFGNRGVEPYKTFWNLLNGHYAMAYRLSGLLLGFIYRVNGLRSEPT